MVILGIDVSLASSGFGIIDENGQLIKYGKVRTDKSKFISENDRINYICDIFKNLVNEYNVTDVLLEDAFVGKNRAGGMSLKKLQGALIRAFKELDNCCCIPVASWRKSLLKSTKKVDKEDVVKYIRANIIDLGKLISKGVKKNDDTYEGIGISFAYLYDKDNIIKKNKY